jgi:hypothetical protein
MISETQAPADVAAAHRERWIAARCVDRAVVRLDGAPDLLGALRAAVDAAEPGALVLDGLPDAGLPAGAAEALAAAVQRGWGAVIAVHGSGDALPAGPTDDPEAVAARLADALPGATVIPQQLAEVSIIAGDGPLTATLERPEPDPADVEAWIVVAGLPAEGEGAAPMALALRTVHRAYARWLDAANAALREANVRMARERLGTHDAAAATIARKVTAVQAERDEIHEELLVVRNDAMQYFQITQRKLNLPHYRVAEGIAQRAGRIPGAHFVGRLITRRMQLPPGD